jgi:hypothetical protein
MPELDFMVVADYVRAEGGVLHMIAAGFDTLWTPTVPAVRQVSVGLRLLVDVAEARETHRVTLLYQNADGQVLLRMEGVFGPLGPEQPLPPPGRPYGVPLALTLPMPMPAYGDYSLELFMDDQTDPVKSITLTIAPPPALNQPSGNA